MIYKDFISVNHNHPKNPRSICFGRFTLPLRLDLYPT